jgi:hypothetical protein
MLPEKEFQEKYDTKYCQRREESYLETVSAEDREIYTDGEILTGLNNVTAHLNKFFQTGCNKGKTYDTTQIRFVNAFKKYIDGKLKDGKEDEVFERLWKSSRGGSFNHLKYLFDRVAGKMEDNINVSADGEVSFTIDNSKLIRDLKEKKEKENEKE